MKRSLALIVFVFVLTVASVVSAAPNTDPVSAGFNNPIGNEIVTHVSHTGKVITVDPIYFFTG